MKEINTKRCIYGLFTVLVMAAIFILSGQNGSDSHKLSESFINLIMSVDFLRDIYIWARENMSFNIRSLAHVFEYFLLGVCVFLTINTYNIRKLKKYVISTCICTVYMITDLIHQYFTPGRGISVFEATLDFFGYTLGICIALFVCAIHAFWKNRQNSSKARIY